MALLDAVRSVASQATAASLPAGFFFGKVTSLAPLTIRAGTRFDITGDSIILTQELKAGGVSRHSHTLPAHATQPVEGHEHRLAVQTTDTGASVGLAVGDSVVLLRNHGGQQYLVLGRL